MNLFKSILHTLALWGIGLVFLVLDACRWVRVKVLADFTTARLRQAFLTIITVLFFAGLVVQCRKSWDNPPPPMKKSLIMVDGTAHPFRDTLVVYRDRIVQAPADTVVKVLRRIVRDTVWIEPDSAPVPKVCIPESTLRRATERILSDSIKAYDDSVRHHYDSLQIKDLQNTPPDTVIKALPGEGFFSALGKFGLALGLGALIGGGVTIGLTH